ncbi:MAG: HesA/MoeB/ThiF family protein [Hadesarchaea archaeon]|nr:HesA/MoeB/ThiF family protein [Hadesarchaea archaeon]
MPKDELSEDELELYNRQIIIPDFGEEGQRKIKNTRVTLLGLGGLGSPIAIYLTAAGVGRLTIIDNEEIELSNLNRQVLHWSKDLSRLKVDSGLEKLKSLNPKVDIDCKVEELNSSNVEELLSDSDILVDGLDNFPTRYLVNETCVKNEIPFVHGAVEGLTGQLTTIIPGKGPCLKCIFPNSPPEKSNLPILGATPGVIGSLEAMEVIKIITGIGEPMTGRLLSFNGQTLRFNEVEVKKRENCPVCKDT